MATTQILNGFSSPLAVANGGTGGSSVKVIPFADSLFANGNGSTSSATFVDITNSSKTVSFPTNTENVIVNVFTSSYSTVALTSVEYRAVIDATNSSAGVFYFNSSGMHLQYGLSCVFAGPFSGNLTVKLQWRRATGTGTLMMDSVDFINWTLCGSY